MPETTIPEPAEKVAPTRGPWTVNGEGGIVGRVQIEDALLQIATCPARCQR